MPFKLPDSRFEMVAAEKDHALVDASAKEGRARGSWSESSEETLDINTGLPFSSVSLSLFDDSQENMGGPLDFEDKAGSGLEDLDLDFDLDDLEPDQQSEPRPSKRVCLGLEKAGPADVPAPAGNMPQVVQPAQDFIAVELNEADIVEPKALQDVLKSAPNGLLPPNLDQSNVDDKPILAWAKPLLKFFEQKFQGVTWRKALRMSTCCSGTGAPKHALSWMGVPVLEVYSVDPKKAVTTMLRKAKRDNGPLYHFATVQDILRKEGWCTLHDAHVQVPISRSHLKVAGFPCAPFSTQRPARWSEGGWQAHKEAKTMEEVGDVVHEEQPLLVVLENVPGFLRKSRPQGSKLKINMR